MRLLERLDNPRFEPEMYCSFIGTALALGLGIASAAAGVGSAAIGAHAAGKAADAQSNAANYAATLQKQAADESLAFQKQQWETTQKNLAPWLNSGTTALGNLNYLLGNGSADNTNGVNTGLGGYGSLMKPFDEKFVAPTDVTEQNDPGYQFRLKQGQKALDTMAAHNGTLFSGGTAKAAIRYNSDFASKEYGNVYDRVFNEYANRFNVYNTNQTNQYNKLANLSGLGQTTATQLGTIGSGTANSISNTLMNSATQQGLDAKDAAAAKASGYVGSANAWGGALTNGVNNLTQLYLLSQLGQGGQTGCWVAAELYGGWTDARTTAIRRFLFTSTLPRIVRFAKRYTQDGEQWAAAIRTDPEKRAKFRRLFDGFLEMAVV